MGFHGILTVTMNPSDEQQRRERLALDSYQLLARVLHDVHTVDTSRVLLDVRVDTPIITRRPDQTDTRHFCLLDADTFLAKLEHDDTPTRSPGHSGACPPQNGRPDAQRPQVSRQKSARVGA